MAQRKKKPKPVPAITGGEAIVDPLTITESGTHVPTEPIPITTGTVDPPVPNGKQVDQDIVVNSDLTDSAQVEETIQRITTGCNNVKGVQTQSVIAKSVTIRVHPNYELQREA